DLEDPSAQAGIDAGVPARPLPLPDTFNEVPREAERYLRRPVMAAVEHDHDIVGKTETGQALGKLVLLVVGDDEGRKLQPTQAAALVTERHSRSAAASTASTERPSINVSVLRWSKSRPNMTSGGSVERT